MLLVAAAVGNVHPAISRASKGVVLTSKRYEVALGTAFQLALKVVEPISVAFVAVGCVCANVGCKNAIPTKSESRKRNLSSTKVLVFRIIQIVVFVVLMRYKDFAK